MNNPKPWTPMNEVRAFAFLWRNRTSIGYIIKETFLAFYCLGVLAFVEYPRARWRLTKARFNFRRHCKAERSEARNYVNLCRN